MITVLIICISSGFVIIISGLELYYNYRNEVSALNNRFESIEKGLLEPITYSVFSVDIQQLQIILEGIVQQEHITFAEVKELGDKGIRISTAGEKPVGQSIGRTYDLFYDTGDSVIELGTLNIAASVQSIRQSILSRIWQIIRINLITVFLLSVLIWYIVRRLVVQRLSRISDHTSLIDFADLEPLSLKENQLSVKRIDELDMVVIAINRLIKRVQKEFESQKAAEASLKKSLKEKTTLLREIHHRVKNNLQLVMSMLNLQIEKSTNEHLKNLLSQSRMRIQSIAAVHQHIYNSENLSEIDMYRFIRDLVSFYEVFNEERRITLQVDSGSMVLDIEEAIPCALIINEAVSNAVKHAFKSRKEGTINISFGIKENQGWIQIKDDGSGLPEGFQMGEDRGFGFELIDTLTNQLLGKYRLSTEGGLCVSLEFPASLDRSIR